MLLRRSSELHDPSGHATIAATFFDREPASKPYCRRTNYRVQPLKATAIADTETQAVLDVHCTTSKRHDTKPGWQVARVAAGDLPRLAADKGYDWMQSRETLREEGGKPLIKHRIFRPSDHAHNARVDGPRYRQRSMCETVFSVIKCTHGDAVRARTWDREFRGLVLKYVVHNIKRPVTQ